MKTDDRINNKGSGSVRIKKGPSSEKIIDRIVGHLTLAVILLLVGLLFTDRWGFRGFPFGWFHHPEFIKYGTLAASFLTLLALTVCADIISAVVGRTKEPVMDAPMRKEPDIITTETTVVPARRDVRKDGTIRKDLGSKATKPLIKPADIGKIAAGKKNGAKKLGPVIWVIIAIVFFAILGIDENENYDYDTSYDDDTYDYEMSDEYTLKDIADDIMYNVTWGDYEYISEAGDTEPIEEFADLSDYQAELLNDTYYLTDDNEHAVCKYILYQDSEDENATVYLAGLQLGGDVSEDYPTDTKVEGFTIYKFGSYDEFQKYCESAGGEISIDEADCVSIGEVKAEDKFILNMQ